jgi:Putative lumazine-binding
MNQIQAIASMINGYFNLMYDADDGRFPKVFHSACLVHGMRDGKLMAWSASEFRDIMRSRPSPASMKSPREQEILSIEHTAPELAVAKVRVRIGQTCFIDHLTLHLLGENWLITSKAFHIAQVYPPGS